ncbi:C13 family peptidase [Phenylobacterium sp.]|jgi:hypothetical protein|uniref:C13 family peptidase n=1 Tax=Phenylobacterium sp. TaxID=1871053 RepID=UPI002F931BDA
MTRGLARLVALLGALWLSQAAPATAGPFSDWAAVVVAGDWHAHNGGPTEAFDNARRDVAQTLGRLGFRPENLRQFSVRPERYADTRPGKSQLDGIYAGLAEVAERAGGGCLVYLTSHGSPQGVLVDQQVLAPGVLGQMVDRACGQRPTVVVISACFSGVFVPALAAPNRMILTAARRDRSSFGCGETDRYPYFDDCFLQSAPRAAEFAALGRKVQACVAEREVKEGMKPPSEPQLYIGPQLRPLLPLYPFGAELVRRN